MSGHRGSKNKFAKLIDLDVYAMRALYRCGMSPYVLAKIFEISRPHAKRIVRGEKWGWL